MKHSLVADMKMHASFVAGRHAWKRSSDDPAVASALSNAAVLLKHIKGDIGEPLISGGTTADPDIILTLGWLSDSTDKSYGVYVVFRKGNRFDLISTLPGYNLTDEGLSFEQILNSDIKGRFTQLDKQVKRLNPANFTL